MDAYELVFISKDKGKKTLDPVKKTVKDLTGKIVSEQEWGKKDFAYPIKKERSGYYFLWRLKFDKKKLPAFKKKLEWNEDILRYLLLKVDQKSETKKNKQS